MPPLTTYNKKYSVIVQVKDRIVGGIPKSPDMIEGWVLGKGVDELKREEISKNVLANLDVSDAVDEAIAKQWTTFLGNEKDGYYIEPRQVISMFKDGIRVKELNKVVPALTSKFSHGVRVKPEKIYLGKKIDGWAEKPLSVMTAKGPRTALKRFDYILAPKLAFEIWIACNMKDATGKDRTDEIIRLLLDWGQDEGIGASRSQGEGLYEIVKVEEIAV